MRHSGADKPNPRLHEWTKDYADRDNNVFFTDALSAMKEAGIGNGGLMTIAMIGSRDIPGVTLRHAQSVLRWDRRPSLWSHVLLVRQAMSGKARSAKSLAVWEATLHPRTGIFPRPEDNGVTESKLNHYRDPAVDANVALLAIEMDDKTARGVRDRAKQFNIDRTRYDLWDTLAVWQSYLWSQGARANPLQEGAPIPAALYAQLAFEAVNLDLSPGADERNSAPEHLWNLAMWWHKAAEAVECPIHGYYVLRDEGCAMLSREEVEKAKL